MTRRKNFCVCPFCVLEHGHVPSHLTTAKQNERNCHQVAIYSLQKSKVLNSVLPPMQSIHVQYRHLLDTSHRHSPIFWFMMLITQ